MPIYAFECTRCGHQFDRLQRLSDADPTTCPACAQESLRRQLTAPSFRLAGAGWYETDFKKDGDRKRNLADAGGDGKAEAKPDAAKPDAAKPDAAKPDTAKPDTAKPAATSVATPARSADSKPGAAAS